MIHADGYSAFKVREEGTVGIYDIYYADEWIAQVRFNRKKGVPVALLSRPEYRAAHACLRDIAGRDEWRAWLVEHQSNL